MNKNELLYQNANIYRLHADNLRWSLFIGYIAVLGFVYEKTIDYLLIWIFSAFFLFILAVQQWFYNLFAQYAKFCDENICKNEELVSLEEFAKLNGKNIKLDHPAYTFALLTVSICTAIFASKALNSLLPIQEIPIWIIYLVLIIMHILFVILLSIFWDKMVYKGIIKTWSNIWKGTFKK